MDPKASLLQHTSLYELNLYPLEQILQLTWLQPPSSKEYETGTLALLETLKQHPLKKLVVDCSNRGNPAPQDLLWLTHRVFPFFCAMEVKYLALVVPQNPDHARNLESCIMTAQVTFLLQFFHTTKDATKWLAQVNEPMESKPMAQVED
ncbi:hypothetical protein ACD591_18125 [Rufibacter glacialis]|uniref:STAS/SEC14 domain-containing protein n=1 Tax=Rufibacter glacialis TaxID=1259555 RepID=A0A5M8Q819_9BACT|nr:hypothetical protein [Rufibacter glacialis]KAA6430762.1 hypothetical protein FOE74_20045 [Rufibacter glacialis]GGK86520.1 hypothetical protein GCM10011405_37840 [Rufibacter glacialis]